MSLSMPEIELIANKILNKEELNDVNIIIDYGSSKHPTHFTKSNKTIHIYKRSLGATALTSGISEEVVLTIRIYLEIGHVNNCQLPKYDRYEQLLFLKTKGEISINELMEYNKILKDIDTLAWDYCENRIRAEYSIYFDDCKRLRNLHI